MAKCCHPLRGGGGGLSRISKCLCDRVCGFNSSLVSLTIMDSDVIYCIYSLIGVYRGLFELGAHTRPGAYY